MSIRLPVAICFLIILGACSKVNQENYSKLKFGMTKSEVEAAIGAPRECAGAAGMSSCTWGDELHGISVQYAGDKVLLYSGKGLK